MSRIGKAPITVPSGVDVAIKDGTVTVKGPMGELSRPVPGAITVRQEDVKRRGAAPNNSTRGLVAVAPATAPLAANNSTRGFAPEALD